MSTKNTLLQCLKEKRETWISGEQLSKGLSVSRAAVWKHVSKLREEGYVIESSPGKGYLLSKDSDLLLPNEIRQRLNTKIFGKRLIEYLRQVDSTNTRAKYLAEQGAPEGTLVIAEKQTKGRGRRGRSWFSSEGNGIYATLILRPAIAPGGAPRITLMTAVALAEALLSHVKLDIRIKWPNDIVIKGKKLAGILTEISTEMDAVNYIIVGLGLNANTPQDGFPDDLKDKATSLRIETGDRSFSRSLLIRAFLEHFEKYYEMFIRNEFALVMKRWRELSGIVGQNIIVDVIGQKHVGKVLEIDDDGVLILQDDKGTVHRVFSGDVSMPTS